MSFREFEDKSHAKFYSQFRPQPPKSLIQRVVQFLQEKYSGKLEQAVDLGCGSGQCTFLLSDHFDKVLGLDFSAAQIDEANEVLKLKQTKNVSFTVSSADKIPLDDKSVQLITACTAAHWFDLPKVYDEGRRVLCPGGVMAFFCNRLPIILFKQDSSKDQAIADLMSQNFEILLEFFARAGVEIIEKEYRDIIIPYSDYTREEHFTEDNETCIYSVLGYVKSFSPFQNYCKAKGQAEGDAFIEKIQNGLSTITGIMEKDFDKPLLIDRVDYYMVMARL